MKTSSKTYFCLSSYVLGGYNIALPGAVYSRQYVELPLHNAIYFAVDFWLIDSWDPTDHFILFVEDTPYDYGYVFVLDFPSNFCGKPNNNDLGPLTVKGQQTHTLSALKLRVEVHLDEQPDTESLGVRNVKILFRNSNQVIVSSSCIISPLNMGSECSCQSGFDAGGSCSPCDPLCSSCYGPTSADCYACADDAFFDGTRCFRCHQSCTACYGTSSSECFSCAASYYLHKDHICLPTCDSPLAQIPNTNQYAVKYGGSNLACVSKCDSTTQHLYPNQACLSECPAPFQTLLQEDYKLCVPTESCGSTRCVSCVVASCPNGYYCDAYAGLICLPNSFNLHPQLINIEVNEYVINVKIRPTALIIDEVDEVLQTSIPAIKSQIDYDVVTRKTNKGEYLVKIDVLRPLPIVIDSVEVHFLYSPSRLKLKGSLNVLRIYYTSPALQKLSNPLKNGSSSLFYLLIICTILLAIVGKLSSARSLFLTNQYIYYLLYLNVNYPETLKLYLRTLNNYSLLFSWKKDTTHASTQIDLPQRFLQEGFFISFFHNTIQMASILGFMIVVIYCIIFIRLLIYSLPIRVQKVYEYLHWNGVIAQGMNYCLPLLVVALLQIHQVLFGSQSHNINSATVILSASLFSVVFITLLRTFSIIRDIPHEITARYDYFKLYESLWNGLQTSNRARYYYWILMMRGALLSFVLVICDIFPHIQISTLIILQGLVLIWYVKGGHFRGVFRDDELSKVNFVVEVCLLLMKVLILTLLIIMKVINSDSTIIGISLAILSLGLILQLIQALYSIYVLCKDRRKIGLTVKKFCCRNHAKTKIRRIAPKSELNRRK